MFSPVAIFLVNYFRSRDIYTQNLEYTRVDALVAERLTASKRIYDIYGHCGIGILSEFFPHDDIEDIIVPGTGYLMPYQVRNATNPELKSYNNFTGREKLVMSLQMAEAVADLHGNEYGVIVHQDIHPAQFFWTEDKSMLKLNDFNRAEFMLWDENSQDYCKYTEGPGSGNVSRHVELEA
jgi:serine/threonine protein kinase